MSAAPAGVEEVCEFGAAVLRVCAKVLVHFVEGFVFGIGGGALVGVGAEEDDADGVGGGGGGGEEGHQVGGEDDVAWEEGSCVSCRFWRARLIGDSGEAYRNGSGQSAHPHPSWRAGMT